MTKRGLHPQFLTNEKGERLSVVLPIEEFNDLLEDLEDSTVILARRGEETISHQELLQLVKYDENLQNSLENVGDERNSEDSEK